MMITVFLHASDLLDLPARLETVGRARGWLPEGKTNEGVAPVNLDPLRRAKG
jgi:hypothetical protein